MGENPFVSATFSLDNVIYQLFRDYVSFSPPHSPPQILISV